MNVWIPDHQLVIPEDAVLTLEQSERNRLDVDRVFIIEGYIVIKLQSFGNSMNVNNSLIFADIGSIDFRNNGGIVIWYEAWDDTLYDSFVFNGTNNWPIQVQSTAFTTQELLEELGNTVRQGQRLRYDIMVPQSMTLEENVTLKEGAFLQLVYDWQAGGVHLTVSEGVTLTVNGTMVANGGEILVNGELVNIGNIDLQKFSTDPKLTVSTTGSYIAEGAINVFNVSSPDRCLRGLTLRYFNKTSSNGVTTYRFISTPEIMTQPEDFTGVIGEIAVFTVEATGAGLTYQWQWYNGSSWANTSVTGNRTHEIHVEVTEARFAYQYRCVIIDNAGSRVISKAVRIIRGTNG